MFVLFIGLLVLWVILGIIGLLVKAAAWLFVVALVLFVLTVAGGAIHAMVTQVTAVQHVNCGCAAGRWWGCGPVHPCPPIGVLRLTATERSELLQLAKHAA